MDDKRLFLLDAYALIYRAYYALIRSPRLTTSGFNTSAIFGFCNTLDEILRKERPTHIAVCFDPPGGHTFRHEIYPQYKAQRDAQPEDITLSIPYIKDIIAAYNIPAIEIPGYEADDVIGTLSRLAEAQGFTTFMMTPDKDYGQLVTDKVFMYRPSLRGRDFEIRGVSEVCERYGISRPAQVIDLLALQGDASDNIPGCPGVGEKTAARLIQQWDSVENLLANVNSLKGALKTRIEQHAEEILFSKMLVTIRTDVPVPDDLDSFTLKPENRDELRRLFSELEFRTFLARLNDNDNPPLPPPGPVQQSLFDIPDQASAPVPVADAFSGHASVIEPDQAAAVITRAIGSSVVALSFCVQGDEAMTARILGVALSFGDSETCFIPLSPQAGATAAFAAAIAPLFSSKTTIVSYDIKRDIILLRRLGIPFASPYFDITVAHYLLQPELRHRVSDIAAQYLGLNLRFADDDNRQRQPKAAPTVDFAAQKFGETAFMALRLMPILEKELSASSLTDLYNDIEAPLIPVLADMEWNGVRIDVPELNELSRQLSDRLAAIEQRCYDLAGHKFNLSSPRQVGEVLFGELNIDSSAKRTKKGYYSTTEEILEKLQGRHEIVGLILKSRSLSKLLATYINALPALINPQTGKIHTTYNQTVTATGRISSANPNLQNIPIRTDDGREIRRAFIPDKGNLLLSADYSQIELRLMADLSGDPDMIAAFASGSDIHRATAAKIYKVPLQQVSDTQRRNAKTANFGIIYGISAFGLSERLSIPRAEAKMLIDGYFESYPHIRDYIAKAIADAREKGYVSTVMGRKRFLPDISSRNAVVRSYAERNAVNAPLQGSAADIIKLAMIRIWTRISRLGLKSRMIMQVHDELIFNVVPNELATLQQIVTSEMENAYHGRVKLEVASGVGINWLEAH